MQPVARLAALARAQGIPFHTDAVQAAGWLPLDTAALGVDALSISGHKLGAPKGSGALFVRSRTRLEPVIHGGGQERGRRSGTENVAGAVALATALTLARGCPGGPCGPGRRPAGRLHPLGAGRGSGRGPDRPSGGAAALRGVVLLPGDQRRVRAAGTRAAGRHLLQRVGLRGGLGRAVAGAARAWASTRRSPRPRSASASTPPSRPPSCRRRRPRSAPPSAASGPSAPPDPRCPIT